MNNTWEPTTRPFINKMQLKSELLKLVGRGSEK